MTDELNRLMDEATHTDAPPSHLDTDTLLHKGRQGARRHRRLVVTGAVAAVLAIGTPVGLLATAGADPSDPDHAAPAADPLEPPYDLPQPAMKDGYHYQWDYWGDFANGPGNWEDAQPVPTEETEKYDAAMWDYFDSTYDDVAVDANPNAGQTEWVDPDDEPNQHVLREELELNEYAPDEPMPTATLSTEPIPNYSYSQEVRLGGADAAGPDWIQLTVYPEGGYRPGDPGNEDPTYLYTCTDRPGTGQPAAADRECEESTGPNGETIVTITASNSIGDADSPTETTRDLTTVLYRADGTAIVLFDEGPTAIENNELTTVYDPTMSADEQLALLLSMPDTPVH